MYILRDRPVLCNPNAKCKYHRTNEMIEYPVKGIKCWRKCDSIFCEKHTWLRREDLAVDICKALECWSFSYFCSFPIGPMICGDHYSRLWTSFYGSMRTLLKDQAKGYLVMKECQGDLFGLHAILVSDEPIDTIKIAWKWLEVLVRKTGIKRHIGEVYVEETKSNIASAKYVVKDTNDKKGIQIITRDEHKRLVQSSNNFWRERYD